MLVLMTLRLNKHKKQKRNNLIMGDTTLGLQSLWGTHFVKS